MGTADEDFKVTRKRKPVSQTYAKNLVHATKYRSEIAVVSRSTWLHRSIQGVSSFYAGVSAGSQW
jgi:hypothetical protein